VGGGAAVRPGPLAAAATVLIAWSAAHAGVATDKKDVSVATLSWLAGCWESARGERRVEEQWMMPGGGTMLGMSRTIVGERTTEFEFMQIREERERLVFTARPSGQEEASFRSIELTASKVVFENAAHDFPQRIIYRLEPDGSLVARIEGQQGGRPRGVDFPMQRRPCAGGAARQDAAGGGLPR
jgi:hypothetical protein